MDASRSMSSSPDADDQNSSIDFEEELKQELENEMSASYDNLFEDDSDDDEDNGFGDTRSVTGISTVEELGSMLSSDNDEEDATKDDYEDDDDLFGDGSMLESADEDEELNLDFGDPLAAHDSQNAQDTYLSTNGTTTKVDEDSASDDEFEAVDFDLDTLQAELDDSLVGSGTQDTSKTHAEADSLKRKRVKNLVRIGDIDLLERYKDEHPSLILHLFDSHFRFEGQEGVFLYNGPMRFFFEALNAGQIPIDLVDVLSQVNCRYFDGCLIVKVHDHRRPAQEPKTKRQRVSNLLTRTSFSKGSAPDTSNRISHLPSANSAEIQKIPEPGSIAINGLTSNESQRSASTLVNGTMTNGDSASDTLTSNQADASNAKVYKKVMRPTSETINLDILLACERSRTKLSPDDVLELESMVLMAIEEPLDLEPDVQVSRVSNAIRFVEYGHLLPRTRRKYNSAEIEAEQAEREEKLKLLTLMDDRKAHEFQPSFNRVSQVNEWRHKKYVNDAEVYPAAVPSAPSGKKAPPKKNRSQMSLFSDGRRVIRTLRFVQTTSGRSTHTVFHVLELPDNRSLQGIMRWGTLPDTSINGGSRTFSFPNEEIMQMHIDNFKLLLGIENNRLIYDSIYPNGVPTSGPPPTSPVVAAPSASTPTKNSVSASASISVSAPSPIVTNAPVSMTPSKATSPTTESASQSPVAAASFPTGPDTPKQKAASVTKNSARNSRKKSPQPRQKKSAASNTASAEPEDQNAKDIATSGGLQKAKLAGSAKPKTKSKTKAKGSAASRGGTPATKDADAENTAQPTREETPASAKSAEEANDRDNASTSGLQAGQMSVEPEALNLAANAEESDVVNVSATGKKTPAKGGSKAQRKKATPKEKKPRAKSKTAGAKGAKDAASKSKAGNNEPTYSTGATGDKDNAAAENDGTPLVRTADYEQSAASIAANGSISISPSVSNASLPMQSQASSVSQTPLLSTPSALSSQANSAQAMANVPFELPKHITKEYLQANPHYYAILRNHMAQFMKQRQQQPGVPNIGSPNALGSPQMRPGAPSNMTAIAQMLHAMQGGNEPANSMAGNASGSNSTNAVASPASMASALGASPASAAASMPQAQPGLMSPTMRPNSMPTTAGGVPPNLQQLQPTKEDVILIQQYCRLMDVPFQNIQAPQFALLVRKAKTGELRQAVLARFQAVSQQQQQQQRQQTTAGANGTVSNSSVNDAAGSKPQQQLQHPANASSSVQNSPVASNALPMNASGASLPGNIAPSGVQSANPMQLPPELANLPPQERMRLVEMVIQRQRAAAMNGTGAHMQGPATSIQQQALATAIALQQQRNAAASGGGSLSVSTPAAMASPGSMGIQTPTMRPMRPSPSATNSMQSRPLAAVMGSPTPAPSVPSSAPMGLSAGQRLLQQATLANMNPQQRQEFIQRVSQMQQMQQMQQIIQQQQQQQTQQSQQAAQAQQQQAQPPQAAPAPRPPQINMAMILQQFLAGRINPTALPPNVIAFLLQNAQAQMTPEQRQTLQRVLAHHLQTQQNNTSAAAAATSAGPIRPGGAA
ncbi:Transcription factor spt20 [Coemansia sp. RSA 487]|nr:Transcription factor spt20 [Coemansia sp. RSA 1843]KAJ2214433.1 Transcription factor spt20 [Coemansia sp. RSA 487]